VVVSEKGAVGVVGVWVGKEKYVMPRTGTRQKHERLASLAIAYKVDEV
jgi:hypothetical protein